ncbi:MAG: fused MFS/spermidine synthase [Gemmataceae bacterium]
MLPGLFALTLFLSAALLFLIQPLVGKLLLPLLGGTPAVWNTCLFFFQTLLWLGYLYAHLATDRLGVRRQAWLHLALLMIPPGALALGYLLAGDLVPILTQLIPTDEDYPALALLLLLLVAAGPIFFVLATTGPLLQRWVADLGMGGRSPYVLYAASNTGSLLGLLAYPFLVEPTLTLTAQQWLWAAGVMACVLLLLGCAVLTGWYVTTSSEVQVSPAAEPLRRGRIIYWLGLAALTSALLNATTTHMTTDMAPMPLLWVVPLALYLLSFIIVFWRWPDQLRWLTGRVLPMLLLFLAVVLITRATEPLFLVGGLPLVVLLAACLVCHGELAHDRPDARHLTTFYLVLSLGSVLGSFLCVLVAPVLFRRLGVVEYPLVLVCLALVRPGQPRQRLRWDDLVAPLGLGLVALSLVFQVPRWLGPAPVPTDPDYLLDRLQRAGLMFGVPAVLAFALVHRPLRYALCLAVLLAAASLDTGPNGTLLLTERNFFGTVRVTRSEDGRFNRLVHGTTLHGQQRVEESGHPVPLMYYHPAGPVGRALTRLPAQRRRNVGAVGLGCGALAAYARPGEQWTFYEIDPAVIRIAQDPEYFTYLSSCRGNLRIVPGDARRRLEREPDASFDLLLLDAFSSDAIPVHLLTREALALYGRKLRPGGLLLFHVSNRYLDLPPLLGRLAHEAGLSAQVDHSHPSGGQAEQGMMSSIWVLIGQEDAVAALAARDRQWMPLEPTPGPIWTDDFSNLLGLWKHGEE